MSERRFTDQDLHDCARREAGFRRRVYARRVAEGKMTQAQAERETSMMDEIAAIFAPRALL